MTWVSWLIFGIIALAAIPYVWRFKHSRMQPLAAYLIFLTAFAVAAWVTFMALTTLMVALGLTTMAGSIWISGVLLVLATLAGLFVGSWLIRLPPPPKRKPR